MTTIRCGQIIAEGTGTILDILRQHSDLGKAAGVEAPCGGHSTCGKCRVAVDDRAGELTPMTAAETAFFTAAAGVMPTLPEGYHWRLACEARVLAGTIEVLSGEKGGSFPQELIGAQTAGASRGTTTPYVTWQPVSLVRPTLENPIPLTENLAAAGYTGPLSAALSNRITGLLMEQMDGSPREKAPVQLWLAMADGLAVEAAAEPWPICGAAVDLGTTTVAASLWREDGIRLGGKVFANPTRQYGADVISRISYAMEQPDGTARMRAAMEEAVDKAIAALASEAGVFPLVRILAGNGVMEHLWEGLCPAPIGKSPFWMQSRFGTLREKTYVAPAVASYVGGDISMGAAFLLWDKPSRVDKTVLFLDLGTNGELGIYRNGQWIFAATAAGPAFEGAHITLGMAASKGAVTRIQPSGDRFQLTTIGDVTPAGLCGSGILDGIAVMLRLGLLDEYGTLLEDPEAWSVSLAPGLGVDEDGDSCTFAPGIYLTQGDVRQVQTARGAIAAGVEVLCRAAGIEPTQVDEVCLAGSFGGGLDVRSAAAVGLFPAVLADRVTAVGNTSEAGCGAFFLHRSFREGLAAVMQNSRYVELSAAPGFGELFMEKMCFETE